MKRLAEMTNEELWRLFPITLSPHKKEWAEMYKRESTFISEAIGAESIERISHIGSTAVPDLVAKPTVDILLEITPDTDTLKLKNILEKSGYIFSPQPGKPAPHMMFMKGYTEHGFADEVFHLHIRYFGDWPEHRFVKNLKENPDAARKYGELKMLLKDEYEFDRDAYTHAKTEFIKKYS